MKLRSLLAITCLLSVPALSGFALAEEVDVGSDKGKETADVPKIRSEMEAGMSELAELHIRARSEGDMVRATCVADKQERARSVMELATGELLVIQDSGATPSARGFAVEKLQAASDRLDRLVQEARRCSGDKATDSRRGVTRNGLDAEESIPVADPTQSPTTRTSPPTVENSRPPAVPSPSL